MVIVVVLVVGLVAAVYYYGFTEQGQQAAAKAQLDKERKDQARVSRQLSKKPGGKVDAPISTVGTHLAGGAGLACPKCGGTQFKARRSGKSRAGIVGATVLTGGVGGLAMAGVTKQKKVTCVTCGTVYMRG